MNGLPSKFKKENINKNLLLDSVKECVKMFDDITMANIFVVDAIYYQKEVDELVDEPEYMNFDEYVSEDLKLCQYYDVVEKAEDFYPLVP